MRFIVTGHRVDHEMIGELVEIPQAPGEVFAVHPNVFKDMKEAPFSVTHVDSGFRIGKGTSIQGAIHHALNTALDNGPEKLAAALDLAISLRNSVAVKTQ